MDAMLYYAAVGIIRLLQAFPLRWVAWFGRRCGGLAYWLDARHRRTALNNLSLCFGNEKSSSEIHQLARENFRRLGENYCCAVKTASMTWEQLRSSVEFAHIDRITSLVGHGPHRCIVAIGHFGNFELYARFGQAIPGCLMATTYRALNQPSLNRLMQSLRAQSGCLFFERRTQGEELKTALRQQQLILGLLTDQHAGPRGVRVPFLGHECSTSPAAAILALRHNCPLFTGFCYRVGLGRWRIEAGPEILTRRRGSPRTVAEITRDINSAFDAAVRRDPANWFWVHNRWRPAEPRRRKLAPRAEPAVAAHEKMEGA